VTRLVLCFAALLPLGAQAQTPASRESTFARLLRAPQTNAVRDSLWDIVARAPATQRDSLRRLILSRTSPLGRDAPPPKLTAAHAYFQDSDGKGHTRIRAWAKDHGCDSARVNETLAAADTTEFREWDPIRPRVGDTACVLLLASGVPYGKRRISNASGETEYWFYDAGGGGLNAWLRWNGQSWIITQIVQ
jgi:hypothetical protein